MRYRCYQPFAIMQKSNIKIKWGKDMSFDFNNLIIIGLAIAAFCIILVFKKLGLIY
jgi:hypothetical protein